MLERANRPSLLILGRAQRDIALRAARQWGTAAIPNGTSADLLGNELDVELARKVVLAGPDRFRRGAEDVRSYALKREALRRGLVDTKEEGAYRDMLVHLTGAPLVAPAIVWVDNVAVEGSRG
jgi:hypothetical protein